MVIGNNVTICYGKDQHNNMPAVLEASFELAAGRITCFIGQSGAGKTSLFQSIVNLIQHYEGSILVGNKELHNLSSRERATSVGFVFQQFNLFPHLTVLQNCMQPLAVVKGLMRETAMQHARSILERLHIGHLFDAYPTPLSGGQQQRVAIARALCLGPQVLLFDEPTSALDPQNTRNILSLLQELAEGGLTIGITSHDMQFVKDIMDRIYLLDRGQIIAYYDRNTGAPLSHDSVIYRFIYHGAA